MSYNLNDWWYYKTMDMVMWWNRKTDRISHKIGEIAWHIDNKVEDTFNKVLDVVENVDTSIRSAHEKDTWWSNLIFGYPVVNEGWSNDRVIYTSSPTTTTIELPRRPHIGQTVTVMSDPTRTNTTIIADDAICDIHAPIQVEPNVVIGFIYGEGGWSLHAEEDRQFMNYSADDIDLDSLPDFGVPCFDDDEDSCYLDRIGIYN